MSNEYLAHSLEAGPRTEVASYAVLGATTLGSWVVELNLGYAISISGIIVLTVGSVVITLWERICLARDRITLNRERLRRQMGLDKP